VRATVLNDPALAKHAGRFAWLSIDGENSANAAFVERLGVSGYPTFYVLDGASGDVALRWYGSLTAAEFERLLDDGEHAVAARGGTPAETALARADRLAARNKAADAADAYAETLTIAPPAWPARGRAVVSLLDALTKAGDVEKCAAVAERETPGLERGPSFANAAASGLACAAGAPETAAWRAPAITALEPLVVESLDLASVLGDDRSSAYQTLVDLRQGRGDEAGAKAMAESWMAFLEASAAGAKSVEERAALDGHRVAAAIALGDPARAVPALETSQRDLPNDYNPPARLAVLYREMGRYDESLAASKRALDMAYGARKLRIFDARADTYTKMGDAAAARRTLDEALRYADTLPEPQRPKAFLATLKKKADAIGS
jgi:tetratricopeptide (TPR) repeat protein